MFRIRVNFDYSFGGSLQRRQVTQRCDQWSEETLEADAWSAVCASISFDQETVRRHCVITNIVVLHETVAFERSYQRGRSA